MTDTTTAGALDAADSFAAAHALADSAVEGDRHVVTP